MKNKLIHYIFVALLFLPVSALAVTVDQSVILVLPSDSSQYTVALGGAFNSLTINTSSFDFSMSGGQTIRLRSTDKKNLTNNFNAATECKTDYSEVFLTPGTTTSITVTPSGTCTTGSGTGIVGGGGGTSGGSVSVSAPAPAPAPAPVPVSAPSPAPVLIPVPVPVAVPVFSITSDLSLGSGGNEVSELQKFLAKDKEIYPEGLVSGYFGRLTQVAVQRFQARHGLPQVGRVGPQTRQKLSEVFGFTQQPSAPVTLPAPDLVPVKFALTRGLSLGLEGGDVTQLQLFLASDKSVYPEGLVTGFFGRLTVSAVKRFQAKYGIDQLGIVGPKTLAKLNELMNVSVPPVSPPAAPSAPVSPAASSADLNKVQELQAQINSLMQLLNQLKSQQAQ